MANLNEFFNIYSQYNFDQRQYLMNDPLNENSLTDCFLNFHGEMLTMAGLRAINEIELNAIDLPQFSRDAYLSIIQNKLNSVYEIFEDDTHSRVPFKNISLHPSIPSIQNLIRGLRKIGNVDAESTTNISIINADIPVELPTNKQDSTEDDADSHKVMALTFVFQKRIILDNQWLKIFEEFGDYNPTSTKATQVKKYYKQFKEESNLKKLLLKDTDSRRKININKKLVKAAQKNLEGNDLEYSNEILIALGEKIPELK